MKIKLMGSKSTFIVENNTNSYLVDIIGSEYSDYASVKIKNINTNQIVEKDTLLHDKILSKIKKRKIN